MLAAAVHSTERGNVNEMTDSEATSDENYDAGGSAVSSCGKRATAELDSPVTAPVKKARVVPEKKFFCEAAGCGKGYCSKKTLNSHVKATHSAKIDWATVTDVKMLQNKVIELEATVAGLLEAAKKAPAPAAASAAKKAPAPAAVPAMAVKAVKAVQPLSAEKTAIMGNKLINSIHRTMQGRYTYHQSLRHKMKQCNCEIPGVPEAVFLYLLGDRAAEGRKGPGSFRVVYPDGETFAYQFLGGKDLGKAMRYRGSVGPVGPVTVTYHTAAQDLKVTSKYSLIV